MRLKLVKTCYACPEQYDVYDEAGKQVAYFRLRHGFFTVDVPDADGVEIYVAAPNGDGQFDDDERVHYLNAACRAVEEWDGKPKSLTRFETVPIFDYADEAPAAAP